MGCMKTRFHTLYKTLFKPGWNIPTSEVKLLHKLQKMFRIIAKTPDLA